MTLTFVDLIEFADDVQANLWELVLEEVEEKRKKVFNCELLPKQWCEPADLGGESRPDMLRRILTQVPDTWDDSKEDDLFLEQFRESWAPVNVSVTDDHKSRTRNLTRGSSANLSFVVLQELDVMSDQLFADKILSNGLRQLMGKVEGPSSVRELKNKPH